MKRTAFAIVVLVLAVGLLAGCQRMVSVQTGVRIECPYGHVVEENLKTVEVPAKNASAYRVRTEKRVCDQHAKLEALYAEAQAALADGDYDLAKAKLAEIISSDPEFRKATEQHAAIARGEKPKPDEDATSAPGSAAVPAPSGGSTTAPDSSKPGAGDTDSPIGSLKEFVPDILEGFTARAVITEPLAITREYDPKAGSNALLLTIVAEQYRTSAEAKEALSAQMRHYPRSTDTQKDGTRTLHFGSDGRRFVTVSFTDGAVLVILELASRDGVDPIKLKGMILDAATALP